MQIKDLSEYQYPVLLNKAQAKRFGFSDEEIEIAEKEELVLSNDLCPLAVLSREL